MHPVLFELFGFPIRSWSVMLITGFIVAWWLASRRSERYGITRDQLSSLALTMLLSGIVGARVFWVAQDWHNYRDDWLQVFNFTEGGMTSFGGLFFGVAALLVWCRRARLSALAALDLIAAPALIAIGIGRIGCFLHGCCYGSPCDLPWAVTVHAEDGTTYLGHPAQLYDSLMNLTSGAGLFWYERRSHALKRYKAGLSFSLALVLSGATRFIYEMFRIGSSSEPVSKGAAITDAQVVAILMVVAGIILLILFGRRGATLRSVETQA